MNAVTIDDVTITFTISEQRKQVKTKSDSYWREWEYSYGSTVSTQKPVHKAILRSAA
ncbi:hypothetical protein GCM10023116_05800 [Kistimonas scapharcae]|uniref:Uncharacterized protein n=1 Tax=Kistimonas scapharcae TaxID=1036133 RepID=A0ABP8UWM5_9GAMM